MGSITPPSEWRGKPLEFEAYDIVRLFRVLGKHETRADISVDLIDYRTAGRVDFDRLWAKQAISVELEQLIADWAQKLDAIMRKSAGQRNPSEWFKKAECWKEIQRALPAFGDPLPPELSFAKTDGKVDNGLPMLPVAGAHSLADYEGVERCMQISSATWMEVAERGQNTKTIHWTVAGICRTLAGYAADGWDQTPSANQAKPALEALLAVEPSGAA